MWLYNLRAKYLNEWTMLHISGTQFAAWIIENAKESGHEYLCPTNPV